MNRRPLTDEELKKIIDAEHERTGWRYPPTIQVARAVERAHGIGVAEEATNVAESDTLSKCPNCGGVADNGWDRSIPPNPYFCSRCIRGLA